MKQGSGSHAHDGEPHAVYRVRGDYERPIYIGVSHDPAARVRAHRENALWASEIRSWEVVEWLADLGAARIAEREFIRREDPDHNFQHTEAARVVAQAPMGSRRRVNAEVRASRAARIATERLDAAIRCAHLGKPMR